MTLGFPPPSAPLSGLCVLSAWVALAAPAEAKPPASRYAFADRCLTATARPSGLPVVSTAKGFGLAGRGDPLYFKATGLGTYLVVDPAGRLIARDGRTTQPGDEAVWRPERVAPGLFRLHPSKLGRLRFTSARGCRSYPELATGAAGKPRRGLNRDGTVFGYADAHVHVTADLRAGGRTIYGEPFDRFGATEALGHDADEHGSSGERDVTGNLLRSGSPAGTHDTHG